ncbi:carboxymuconolactone decarboxylase family protein [Streptomyces sp. NBC_01423]|uniref:carboxymuconolactone decarboxylase family protein n=1 Tax=Streptomyces sp. NBC_01423 TaxID=2903860 RepID=UPI002E2C8120|nr:carboxymuconolactone decarboxylase family protein [Streptomyces sp. NBC_01423]
MNARLDYFANPAAGKAMKHLMAFGREMKALPLPATTQELVALRISQINGCAACIDMHTKEGAASGESAVRMNLVVAWREATVFTDAERAALAVAEQGTRTADAGTGVDDDTWAYAAKFYDEDQLTALVMLVSFMNAVNRLNIITQKPAGDYEPGQFH